MKNEKLLGQSENPVWAPYWIEMNKSHKSIVTQIPLLREGGVPKGRGGRYTNSIVNESFMHSPTTSPYGYSSFPKEEI